MVVSDVPAFPIDGATPHRYFGDESKAWLPGQALGHRMLIKPVFHMLVVALPLLLIRSPWTGNCRKVFFLDEISVPVAAGIAAKEFGGMFRVQRNESGFGLGRLKVRPECRLDKAQHFL